jgi:predicted kinase
MKVNRIETMDRTGAKPTLLLFTGPPGTGKSTLAEAAASSLRAPVFGWDWVMGALTGFDEVQNALRAFHPTRHRAVGWEILWNLATAQLRQGRSVVLDGVARQREVDATRHRAAEAGARCLVVVTRCSDRSSHRERIEGRQRNIPGWHELDWDHVIEFFGRWDEPTGVDLHLDAARPLDRNRADLAQLVAVG